MTIIGETLEEMSRLTGFASDQINFVFCMLSCFPLGLVFRLVFHPRRVSSVTRRVVGFIWGLALSWFCFGWQVLILLAISGLCYLLLCVLNPSVVHKYMFSWSMTLLAVAHLHRQITDYGGYTLDLTGHRNTEMSRNLGQGLTIISDMRGLKGDNFDEWTSSFQGYISDYDSVFCFCVFCLPVIVFSLQFAVTCRQNLMHFLGMARDERSLNDEQRKGKLRKVPSLLEYFSYLFHYSTVLAGPLCTFKEYNDFIDGTDVKPKDSSHEEPSPLYDVLTKTLSSLLCMCFLMLTGSHFPISRNGDPDFINSHHLAWRYSYAYISLAGIRMRYYFAYKLAEAVNNIAGFGFNGYDENGKATGIDLSTVNLFYLQQQFQVRRTCRPLFQKSRAASVFYDVMTCAVTMCCLTFATVPFVLLELKMALAFWRSMYCFGLFWCLVPFLLLNFTHKTKKGNKEEEVLLGKKEKGAHQNKTKSESDLMELVSKANRKLALLKENFMWGLRMR
ncbi:PREDICTED: lysophospholipid acyltransferase 2-like [Acropora digitifera]|uniref:lysophospholipid acyltransferase 2-like n=1 Tax=Acropora digitifera TaxID=70779 RepID=UPI00077B0EE1|nr:PREDICTED: lysophospholipid acyltransferase 2-like [Acropora digitifera]